MSYEQVLQSVIDYWTKVINDTGVEVKAESNLMDDLSLSSLELLTSLLRFESKFGARIPEKALRRMLTIQDSAQVIYELMQQKNA